MDELLKKGKVQESTSAFGHSPVLARKKDGRWRMCINFKPLNKITVKQQFPMPTIDELLDRVHGSAVYSTFDLTDAFLQILIHPDDRHKAAFHTRTRKLEFRCMPVGLVNAPAELLRQNLRGMAEQYRENGLQVVRVAQDAPCSRGLCSLLRRASAAKTQECSGSRLSIKPSRS